MTATLSASDLPVIQTSLNAAMAAAGVSPSRRARISLRFGMVRNHFGHNTYIVVSGKVPADVRARAASWIAKALTAKGFTFTAAGEGFAKIETAPKATGSKVHVDCFCDMW